MELDPSNKPVLQIAIVVVVFLAICKVGTFFSLVFEMQGCDLPTLL